MISSHDAITIHQVFRHPVQQVFRAFSSADAIGQWFAPHESIKTVVTRFEFVEGGAYRMVFTLPDGITTSLRGTFQTIGDPKHLVFSFCWEKPDPHADIETQVTVDLRDIGDSTEIIVSHARLNDDAMRARHTDGWHGTLFRLGVYLDHANSLGEQK